VPSCKVLFIPWVRVKFVFAGTNVAKLTVTFGMCKDEANAAHSTAGFAGDPYVARVTPRIAAKLARVWMENILGIDIR